MNYRCETDLAAIKDSLQNVAVVAFDFETAPLLQYRDDPRAALDAYRACIVGISLSVAEDSAFIFHWNISMAAMLTPIR